MSYTSKCKIRNVRVQQHDPTKLFNALFPIIMALSAQKVHVLQTAVVLRDHRT